MLVWEKETVSREGLRKQTTAQQNKNTRESALLLSDFRVVGGIRLLKQEVETSWRSLDVSSGTEGEDQGWQG